MLFHLSLGENSGFSFITALVLEANYFVEEGDHDFVSDILKRAADMFLGLAFIQWRAVLALVADEIVAVGTLPGECWRLIAANAVEALSDDG